MTVRVNNDPEHLEADLDAVVLRGLAAIVMPKVETAKDLATLSTLLESAGVRARHGSGCRLSVVAVIESPAALENIHEIADHQRLIGISLGSEDFALSLRAAAETRCRWDCGCRPICMPRARAG